MTKRGFDIRWNHGSPNCLQNPDPALQVYRFSDDTYILRQNKCHSFEAPFLYLLFGDKRAFLLDSGSEPVNGQSLPLREIVRALIAQRSHAQGTPISLVVAHSHSHGDHAFGDTQFASDSDTTVIPPSLEGVKSFFKFTNWPEDRAEVDLGSRVITVIPCPGHEPSHVTIYDPVQRLLLTGDTLYPGFLFVSDWESFRNSINRLAKFASENPVRYVLGAHVEMTRMPGVAYPYGTTYQPNERELQLSVDHLMDLHRTVESLGDNPVRTVRDEYIIEPSS